LGGTLVGIRHRPDAQVRLDDLFDIAHSVQFSSKRQRTVTR
jgi:hypothetical protein